MSKILKMPRAHNLDIEVPLRDALRLAVAIDELQAARVCRQLDLADDVWAEMLTTLQTRLCQELRCAVAIFDGAGPSAA